jgi:hypothetical protein
LKEIQIDRCNIIIIIRRRRAGGGGRRRSTIRAGEVEGKYQRRQRIHTSVNLPIMFIFFITMYNQRATKEIAFNNIINHQMEKKK